MSYSVSISQFFPLSSSGCLNSDGSVNEKACKKIMNKAKNLNWTFHRAFDVASDAFKAVETIKAMGFTRLLTSGQVSLA